MIKRKEQVERYVSLMRIAILDDDPRFSDRLYQKISTAVAKRDWALECQIFSHPQDLLNSDLGTLHAVFLDIDMPEMNGLEVASQIHQHYPDLILVFITAFLQFAPSGYKVSAFRYILKGNYTEELDSCLDAIQAKLLEGTETIVVDSKNLQIEIPLRDILYLEGTPFRCVLLHTTDVTSPVLECRGKMNNYAQYLSDKGFIRLQKSFLVNMSYIRKISGYTAQLRNGEVLKVSEKNYKSICAEYLMWKGRRYEL